MGEHELNATGASGPDPADEAMDRAIKDLERWQLLRRVVPLIASGIGIGWLYADLGIDVHRFWWGSGLAFSGAVLGTVGFVAKWRETCQPGAPTTRHYPLLVLAGALIVVGVFLPPYSLR